MKDRKIARRRKHLASAGKVKIALLVAGRTDRHALIGIALDGALHELRAHDGTVVRPAFGKERRVHAKRLQDAVLDQLADRKPIATLERKLQQHVAGMGIDPLPPGCSPACGAKALSMAMNSASE